MLYEFCGISLSAYYLYRNSEYGKNRRLKNQIIKSWDKIIETLKLTGFNIKDVKLINNGFELTVWIPTGKKYEDIYSYRDVFRDNLKCICEMENIRFSNLLKIKCITNDLGKYEFAPVKSFANQLWVGKQFDTTDYFIDLDKEGHLLVGGQSGGGKSFLLASIITNLIYNNSKYIELYLNQTVKGEIGVFSKCKSVKSVAYTNEEVLTILEKVTAKINERTKLFSSLGIKNLTHYIQKTGKGMRRVFFIVEEASFLNNAECYEHFSKICKAGRSAGVHLIMLVQRSTLENLSGELKSQMCCMTTWQRSDIDSRNIIEVSNAKELKEREVYVWGRKGLVLLKMPFLDEDFKCLKKYVPEIITYDPNAVTQVVKEQDVERISYIDMRLEEYNKINSKIEYNNTIELKEVAISEDKPKKRLKKGVGIKC